jgi:hypothetical protein
MFAQVTELQGSFDLLREMNPQLSIQFFQFGLQPLSNRFRQFVITPLFKYIIN